jgi:gliding motility-associated-like protein
MNKSLLRLLMFVFLLDALGASATHIVGGELNYRWLVGNTYEIRLTVYRDCINGVPPFDDPVSVGIFNNQNNLVNLSYSYTGFYPMGSNTYYNNATFNNQQYGYLIHPHDSATVPNVVSSPCVIPPTNICYRVCHYIDTVVLPPIPGGYHLVYQRCCRNFSIANIVNPLDVGATYDAWIPEQPDDDDSNPVFNSWPPTYICVNQPFVFNHSATDPEGDSIVYQLCDPIDGPNNPCWFDTQCCLTFPQPCGPMPQPPYNPPYINPIWQAPYNLGNVFGGVPLTIDPVTGILTATPNTTGQFVYAVCALEYRNGVLIGQTRRDFQVNIVPCANITVASILSPTLTCGTNQANFTNNSTGASSYFWNFGDTTTLADTSNLFQPTYVYPDTGWHTATLIAYSSINPACNDTSVAQVYVYPQLVANFTYTIQPCTRTVVFNDTLSVLSGTPNYWLWNFGDNTTSSSPNPTHTYAANGNYNVTLIVNTNQGCTDTVTIVVPVNYVPPVAAFNPVNTPCTNTFTFNNQSTGASTYNWNFGDATSSTQTSPSHAYASSGNFNVTLIVTSSAGCRDTIVQPVVTPVLAQSNFTFQIDSCSRTVNFTNTSSNATSYSWNFGDATISTQTNPSHTYAASGTYNVRLIATTAGGCNDTTIIPVPVNYNLPVAAFTVTPVNCTYNATILNQSTGGNSYSWNFGDATTSTAQNPPLHTYPAPGNYVVTLIVTGVANCRDTIVHNVNIAPLPSAAFSYIADTCIWNVQFMNTSVNAPISSWNFGDATTSTLTNPAHLYTSTGPFNVTLVSSNAIGCADTVIHPVGFPPLPQAIFAYQQSLCSRLVTFTSNSLNATTYNWNFGDATTSNQQNPSHTYAANGNYNVRLIVASASGCFDTLIVPVVVNYIPVAAGFNFVNQPCSYSVSFNNLSANATSYFWNFGDSYFSNLQNPSHTYSGPGNYNVTLIASDVNNCNDTISLPVSIAPLAQANFTWQVDTCSLTVNFTNSSLNASSYSWNFGDAATSTQQNPSHTYSSTGNYNVSLVATTPQGCTDTLVVPIPLSYTLPVAAFTYNIPPCTQTVSFNNQSVGGTGYSWNFGDAITSTQQHPVHVYTAPGNYIVTLIIHGVASCADTITQSITINPLPSASFNPVIDICSLTAAFSNTSQNGISYSWNFGDATTSTITNPFHLYPAAGNYSITLVVTDINGCTDTAVQNIVLPPVAQAAFTYTVDTCLRFATFTNNSVNGISYFWNFGDGNTSTLFSPTHTYASNNTYNVTLIVTSASGCNDTILIPVPVSFTPPVAAFITATPLCTQVTTFTNLSTPGVSYAWNFGDNTYSNLANPTHTYLQQGNYQVTLIVSTIDGCGDTTSNPVVINPLPVAAFTPYNDTCSLDASFTNTSQNAVSYSWNFGDNTSSNLQNPLHSYPSSGTYNVTLIVTDVNGCTDTIVHTVNPYILTQASFGYAVDTCARQVNFLNQSGFAYMYSWNFGDGDTSSQYSPIHPYGLDGTYTAVLITNPGTICADTATVIVNYSLAGIGNYWVPNAFTPNNDGKNDIWEIVGEFPCEDLSLYVFNRWGELIHEDHTYPLQWDGIYERDPVKLEVYVYILEGIHVHEVGRVTVIR